MRSPKKEVVISFSQLLGVSDCPSAHGPGISPGGPARTCSCWRNVCDAVRFDMCGIIILTVWG